MKDGVFHIEFRHCAAVQIRFNDIDMLGHVNNAKLQEYFDLGRMTYLQEVIGLELMNGEEVMVIASTHTNFDIPVFLTDSVEVRTSIVHWGTKSMRMLQHLFEKQSGTVKTRCESVMVCIQKRSGATKKLPDGWKQQVVGYERHKLF